MQNSDNQKPPSQAHCLKGFSFSPFKASMRASTTFKRFGSPSDATVLSKPHQTSLLHPPGLPLPHLRPSPAGPAHQASFYPPHSDRRSKWLYGNTQTPLSIPNTLIVSSTVDQYTQVATTPLPGYNMATRGELTETAAKEKNMYALRSIEDMSCKAGETGRTHVETSS
jgi:hypothetical protein